jgi:low temperature requirement protein LtrA
MCLLRRHQADARTRRIQFAGHLCLVASLLLTLFAESFGMHRPAAYNSLRFLLMGSAVTLLFCAARRARSFNAS